MENKQVKITVDVSAYPEQGYRLSVNIDNALIGLTTFGYNNLPGNYIALTIHHLSVSDLYKLANDIHAAAWEMDSNLQHAAEETADVLDSLQAEVTPDAG